MVPEDPPAVDEVVSACAAVLTVSDARLAVPAPDAAAVLSPAVPVPVLGLDPVAPDPVGELAWFDSSSLSFAWSAERADCADETDSAREVVSSVAITCPALTWSPTFTFTPETCPATWKFAVAELTGVTVPVTLMVLRTSAVPATATRYEGGPLLALAHAVAPPATATIPTTSTVRRTRRPASRCHDAMLAHAPGNPPPPNPPAPQLFVVAEVIRTVDALMAPVLPVRPIAVTQLPTATVDAVVSFVSL